MMANERGAKSVLDQPGGAIGAFEAMAARSAERQRRVAAPVEEQHRLLAPASRLLDPCDCARRQPCAARRAFALEVDQRDVRQRGLAEARGKLEPAVASAFGVEPGLDRRRRRGQHDRRLLEPRAHHRHVARVVDDALLLLVGALVLLIDDDEAEVGERQEQRRARADNDGRLAARDRRPDAFALALGEAGVPFGRPCAETRGEAVEKLRGQRDLRQQHQRLALLPQALRRPPRNRPRSCPSRSRPRAGWSKTRGRRRAGSDHRPRRADRG